jgi:uncharacterized membrane protein YeaQ/YmgE (transglycosylase-associated protein family)
MRCGARQRATRQLSVTVIPILVWLGATLLGWIAGEVIATDPAVQPWLKHLLDGQIAFSLDATSAVFGVSPHFSVEGDLVEYIASLLGAVIVLTVGAIWRKRKLKQLEKLALAPSTGAVRSADRP